MTCDHGCRLIELQASIAELEAMLMRINEHVFPGSSDSIDGLKRLVRERDQYYNEAKQQAERVADLQSRVDRQKQYVGEKADQVLRYREDLAKLRDDIIKNAHDVVWVGPGETACERITSILGDDWGKDGKCEIRVGVDIKIGTPDGWKPMEGTRQEAFTPPAHASSQGGRESRVGAAVEAEEGALPRAGELVGTGSAPSTTVQDCTGCGWPATRGHALGCKGPQITATAQDTRTCGCRGIPRQVCDICQGVTGAGKDKEP